MDAKTLKRQIENADAQLEVAFQKRRNVQRLGTIQMSIDADAEVRRAADHQARLQRQLEALEGSK